MSTSPEIKVGTYVRPKNAPDSLVLEVREIVELSGGHKACYVKGGPDCILYFSALEPVDYFAEFYIHESVHPNKMGLWKEKDGSLGIQLTSRCFKDMVLNLTPKQARSLWQALKRNFD